MSYTNTVENIKKHFAVAFGAAFASALLFGLSCWLPIEIAVPLCIFFGLTGIGSIICLIAIIVKWFDENY